jgi:hypothetical protein
MRAAWNAGCRSIPELCDDPDKLLVFVDAGKVIATNEPALSFEYRYTLNTIITDFAGDADAVFAALIAWDKRNQSDLFANADERVSSHVRCFVLPFPSCLPASVRSADGMSSHSSLDHVTILVSGTK